MFVSVPQEFVLSFVDELPNVTLVEGLQLQKKKVHWIELI